VIRRVGKTEPGQVGRNDVVLPGQFRDQVAKHVARGWKPVQQKNRRILRITGLTIKDFETVNLCGLIGDRWRIHE
jgi:hypothetical protein